uniref:Ribonuclease K6 n=2 Tax=Ochotona princeps TaxID=9978 RepID=W0UTH1_OCHPR|nr:TPA: ribonuclease A D1 [Ochotona princeps]
MGSDLGRCLSLLLLLLQLSGAVGSDHTEPQDLTKARWFEIQHIQPSPLQCNRAMRGVNNYTQHCKKLNTFLHDSLRDVINACNTPKIICKNGQHNCHKSSKPVNITHCKLTTGWYPDCSYSHMDHFRFFIVACDPPQKSDPRYPLVPVHLDKVVRGF